MRRLRPEGRAPSGFVKNVLDLADSSAVDLSATWATVKPYFTKVRMRTNCDRAISRVVCGSGLIGGLSSSSRGPGGAAEIASTRGLRADWPVGEESGTNGPLTGGFDVNSASAAWRALVIRSRSSPRGCGCCCRLSKICSEWLIHSR